MSIVEQALERVKGTAEDGRITPSRPKQPLLVPGPAAAEHRFESITIDYKALEDAGLMPTASARVRTVDAFRRIKWPIVRASFSPNGAGHGHSNLVLVTSSLPDEGKSFISVNLAFSIALERDCGVILVDADLAKPHISEVFGVRNKRGLTDLLTGRETDPAKVLLATDTPGFRLLPAGTPDPSAPELLASQRMHELLEWLRENCSDCIVLFDSPPLLATNEAQVLAQSAGQILLVICADRTSQADVKEAVALIEDGKSIKCVLNQVNWITSGNRYGGYYGEGFGSKSDTSRRS